MNGVLLVVAMLLCIVLSSKKSDVQQCRGEKLSDGQFYFSTPYEVKEDIYDCETQWLVDEKVVGICEAEGQLKSIFPVVNLTMNAAILQTCPKRLECLLVCPSARISEKLHCSCDASLSTALPEVRLPNWSVYIWIGVCVVVVLVIVSVIVITVTYQNRQRSEYVLGGQGAAENI